jgi:hypothetical protein
MTNLIWSGAVDRGVDALERKADEQERNGRGGIWPVIRDLNMSGGSGLAAFLPSILLFGVCGMASFAFPAAAIVGAGVAGLTFRSTKSGARLFGGGDADASESDRTDRIVQTPVRQPVARQPMRVPNVTNAFTQQAGVIQKLVEATRDYTGDLRNSATHLTKTLQALLGAVPAQKEIPSSIKTLFSNVVEAQVLPMTTQFKNAGGQDQSPEGEKTLKNTFEAVTEAAASQMKEIGRTNQDDLATSAEVIKRQLKDLSLT